MRPVRDIASIENSRIETKGGFNVLRRDSVEPEPVGTLVMMPFRVAGYDKDCDGSLMARLEAIESSGQPTGWEPDRIGVYPSTMLVVTAEEIQRMFETETDQ